MSSWLTFFRLRKLDEEEENNSEELEDAPLNPSILQELDEEQQAHIKEVFRRAEQSQKEARIVLNTRKLSRFSDARFRGTVDENEEFFTVRNESFVQMDSLPETIEVTEARDSLLNPSYSYSESSVSDSKDTKDSFSEQPGNFTQSIKRLSRQLYRWMSSLDDDGDDILTSARKCFAKYVSKMSHEICTLAIADSVCKCVLDQYCHWLCTVIFTAVYNELKLKYGTDAAIDRYCSELTINIFKCVYMNAVELLGGQEPLHANWSKNDRNVHIALLRASSTTFKKSISCECIQSLAHLIDQESALYHHSELDDDCAQEFCYVLLEDDKEKLSQELTSVLQNFAEELWIHILALVLADVMLKKQGSALQEQFFGIKLTSSAQENVQKAKINSFPSINDYSSLDESSCSVSSDEFANEYTLLDNEKQSLHLYMKQQLHGKMSPPLILYEVDPNRDIYTNPFIGVCETKKQSRPVSRESSVSEFSETGWNTEQQLDSEWSHSENFYMEKSTSISMEQLRNDERTRNNEVMKYIEQIIKEAECAASDEETLQTIQVKTFGQEKHMYNPEFDLTTSLEEWSSSTLNAMINHATSIFDSEMKLEQLMETDLVCSDWRSLNETLKSKNSIHSQMTNENGRKNILVGKEQGLSHSEFLSNSTTKIADNLNEFEENNVKNALSSPNQIHKIHGKQISLESSFSSTFENRASNVPEKKVQDMEEPIWQFNDFKEQKFESCCKFDKLHNTEEIITQFAIDKDVICEDNSGDLFSYTLDERHPMFNKQKSNSASIMKFDETNSTASSVLDKTYPGFDIVIKKEKTEEEQSFTMEEQEWNELANEEIGTKFEIQGMHLKKFEKIGTNSNGLTMAKITKLQDQKKHELRQKNLENYGDYGLSYSISKTKHDEIKYDLNIETEGWETEGEAHQNDNLIGQKRDSENKASEAPDSFIMINTVDIYRTLRSRKNEVNKLKIFEESTAKEQEEVVNVICTAKGTMQADTKIENSIKNKDSILESELFRTSEKISKKDPATSELENASLVDDGFERALDQNLEINIEEMQDNKSTNTRNRSTSKVREENEADDLLFELHLNRSLGQQNFGKKIEETEIGTRSTYHSTSAYNVTLTFENKSLSGPISDSAGNFGMEIFSSRDFKESKSKGNELRNHQIADKIASPQQYPTETYLLDSPLHEPSYDQQKIDCVHSLMSNTIHSRVCTYELDATNNAKSSTFKPDMTVSAACVCSNALKEEVIADNSGQSYMKNEVRGAEPYDQQQLGTRASYKNTEGSNSNEDSESHVRFFETIGVGIIAENTNIKVKPKTRDFKISCREDSKSHNRKSLSAASTITKFNRTSNNRAREVIANADQEKHGLVLRKKQAQTVYFNQQIFQELIALKQVPHERREKKDSDFTLNEVKINQIGKVEKSFSDTCINLQQETAEKSLHMGETKMPPATDLELTDSVSKWVEGKLYAQSIQIHNSTADKENHVQKTAINKESEFKLTQDELEHIAHVSYMAEEEFGKFQTKLPIDKDWVEEEEEGTKSGYEEYSVEESESEKFSRTSSATSGPDSQQQSVDMTINPIQNILPFDATDNITLDDKNVLTKDMEHEMNAFSNKDITNDRISFDDDDSIPAHLLTLSPSADITSKTFDKIEKNLLSVKKMEHINTNVISNVEQEMDAQKVAINKESEFKLTQDELEHIAHVSYMAEEEFGKFQTKLPIDKDWVEEEEEGTKSGYEEYSVEENESEKFSRTSSATSGPDSQQHSVDMTINPIQNILPFDATDNITLDDKNVLTKDMEHEMNAFSNKDITNDRISFDDDDSIPAHLLTLSPSADITSKTFDKIEKNLLSVKKMEHINTNVISNVEQEMDAQKVAINKESEFKLTQDELEHIAHVSYMAEEEFGKFQTKLPIDKDWVEEEEEGTKSGYEEYSVEENESEKFSRTSSATSGPDSQQHSVDMTINPIQNILPFDATDNITLDDKNVLTKDMEHEMNAFSNKDITNDRISFDDDDSIPAHLLTLSPSADITSECWIVEDDENSMLLFGHRNKVVKSIRMLNIEDHKMKIFNQIQKNIQTDQTIYDNGCSMSNPLADSYSPIIQVLCRETEMTYTELEQSHSVYNSYVKIPKSTEGTATVKSVKELEKQKSSRIGYTADQENIEFHTVESGSGDSDHSRRTEAGADATILLETGVSSKVISGVMITDAAVNDQLALSGIIDKSFAHFNIPQVVGIGPATSIDYFNEKQHRQNESRHINTMMKQEIPKQQSKLGAAIQECGSELTMKDFKNSKIVLSDKSCDLEKKFAFQKPWEQRTEQEKHQEQSIIGKSMMELLKDNSFVGIRRNEQLFKDNISNFPKSNCKCSEIVEGEQGVIFGKNKSYSRIQPNGEIEFSLEHSNHYLTDGFNVTSTVTYTDRLYKKMTRNLRFSEKMPHYGRANFWKTFNNDEEYSVKTYIEGMKPSFTRASSVFVVYTDQNLLASQFGTSRKAENSDGVEETLDDGDKSKSNATRKAGNLKEIGIKINPIEHRHLTSDLITSVSALEEKWKRSEVFYLSGSVLSDSTFTKTENAKGKESLERDSTWLLKNEKPRGTYRMNVFERCERESIVGDGSMLHHADCLMRLNFFAERITEQVAELAAVELGNHFRAVLNPRARYFSEMRANIDSQAESAPVTPSESDEEIERKITLGLTEKREPHLVTVPESESSPRSSSWFSLFGGGTFNREDRPRSPISFLWRTSQRQSDASSRKSSPDGRNEFMDLLRRTSGASSNGSDMSTKLPDSALAGLSNEERNHIEKVLSAANRRSRSSQSTPTASRKSVFCFLR
uniref:Bm6279, isoform b n=1 Tax=Brugia malayi TaxID=6279 RepID=A0A1I9G4U8_BRUMA|nr:Bm6279, isoform b [Brugia malayi]